MDFQPPHHYLRPPPPSMSDPHHQHHHHHNNQLPPPPPPPPPPPGGGGGGGGGPWYSNQFQYQQQQPPHPSSPQPPHLHQWAPPPHSDPHPPFPAPPPPAYPSNHPYHNQYLPPRPHMPPPPHLPNYPTQSYSQVNPDWVNPNWGHHQLWEYPAHNNEEDWAAKARAWAAAKAATDNQHQQSQFTPIGRPEEQSHYYDQYQQSVDPQYPDIEQSSLSSSSYQEYPTSAAPPHRSPIGHLQESTSFSSGQSLYMPDGHLPYSATEGTLAGDSNSLFPHQQSSAASHLVHLQEVPSSYSSVAGKEEAENQNEKFYKSGLLSITSTPTHQRLLHTAGRSLTMDRPNYAYGNQLAEPTVDRSDMPLDFAPRFGRDHEPHAQTVGSIDPVAAMPSIQAWTPAGTGGVYPPVPAVLPSGPQLDHSMPAPSPVSGHSAPIFGGLPGQHFQAAISSVGAASFGPSAGTSFHPAKAFPVDGYGASSVSERPKKASVPNWLREEIIKKKAVIATSTPELPEEDTQSAEDENVDKSLGKSDRADSKSGDSSRSTEEEDDDEDDIGAARTAAINNEIKRILTEVLLKVTDELFDEIATKVLSEDVLTVKVDDNIAAPNHKVAPFTPISTPKASAKVLIPAKSKETDSDNVSGKSSSSSPGDVLGLGYISDDDGDDESQSSKVLNSEKNTVPQQPITTKFSDDIDAVDNGPSQLDSEDHYKNHANMDSEPGAMDSNVTTVNHRALISKLSDDGADREPAQGNAQSRLSSRGDAGAVDVETKIDGKKVLDGIETFSSKNGTGEEVVMTTELTVESSKRKKLMADDREGRETRTKPNTNDRQETKRNSAGKDITKEKRDENRRRQDERHVKKERMDDQNDSKERMKEEGVKSGVKSKDSDSRKSSTRSDVKEDRKETQRSRRTSGKEDDNRKRERMEDDKGERSRHKPSDLSRHRRRRSSSVGSKDRNSKDNSVVSHTYDTSDVSSDDSKRKLHSKRRNLSPSPVRSKRRQVSRSPHSKHSQRRHSPYPSLEHSRGRRSRSRSPVRRQR